MTYKEIKAEVGDNLGWDAFTGQFKAKIDHAIRRAVIDLMIEGKSSKVAEIPMVEEVFSYKLPDDCHLITSISITDRTKSDSYPVVETEPEEVDRFSKNPSDFVMQARYNDRILVAVDRKDDSSFVQLYPSLDGIIIVGYEAVYTNIKIDDEKHPPLPAAYQPSIADGATYYLARGEMAKAAKEKDANLLQVYITLVQEHKKTFHEAKSKFAIFTATRSTPPVSKAWDFYEKPESY